MSFGSIEEWFELAKDPAEQWVLAGSPACPPEVLLWLAQNMNDFEYSDIFNNPALPEEAIKILLTNSEIESYNKIELMNLPHFQSEFIDIMAQDDDPHVRAAVRKVFASHPDTTNEKLIEFLHDEYSSVVLAVLERATPKIWEELFKSPPKNEEIEQYVAENVPADFIERAKNWVAKEIKPYFLRNMFIPKDWVDEFVNDKDLDQANVLSLVVRHGHFKDEFIPLIEKSKNVELRVNLALKENLSRAAQLLLVKDKSALVREKLALNPNSDPEIIISLINDKAISVINALGLERYYDYETGQYLDYVGREKIRELVIDSVNKFKDRAKTKTVEGRSESLQTEVFDKARYEELLQDKSIGIQVAATLRAAELGIISFKEASAFVAKNSPSSTAPKNRWVEARMSAFENERSDEILDLVLELKGDQILSGKIASAPDLFSNEQILRISKAHLPITNWVIGRHCDVTSEILDEIAETPSWSYETYESVPLEFGQWEGQTSSGLRVASYPQALAAQHPKTRRETLEKLKKSRSSFVRGVLLQRPDLVTEDDLKKAAKDKDTYIRSLVAAHESVPLDVLEILAGDKEASVRELAASNERATPEIKAIAALLAN